RATVAVLVAGSVALAKTAAPPEKAAPPERRHVDLVICLDTSGSMTKLIEAAKQKLWAVVNELATAKPKPVLRVGLYHYGNDGLSRENGWVERLCPLTGDLDAVYGKLFALRTRGGTEYVARVVRAATDELKWNTDKRTLRMIFVAGNERATQDEKTYKLQDICKAAATKGIIVNTIFCGNEATGRRTGWADAAAWADGKYAAIDQKRGTVVVSTPYDKKLAKLSATLNKTYVPYGTRGKAGKANQKAQDANATSMNAPAAAQRAMAKGSALYRSHGWDLVDGIAEGKVDLAKVKNADLPKNMRKMSIKERKKYVDQMRTRRKKAQSQIKDLGAKRDKHVKAEMAKKGLDDKAALDRVLRDTVREQAENTGFEFEQK
ncbi:MAG: VWA domain-containing protein, partial [Phycisphaerae bacterium]|nr:VWA domain-containing protein [Phycisphaerae bacterium]